MRDCLEFRSPGFKGSRNKARANSRQLETFPEAARIVGSQTLSPPGEPRLLDLTPYSGILQDQRLSLYLRSNLPQLTLAAREVIERLDALWP